MNAGCGRNYFAIDDRIGPRRFEIINLFYILGVPCFFLKITRYTHDDLLQFAIITR